jgi:hypothetical protein
MVFPFDGSQGISLFEHFDPIVTIALMVCSQKRDGLTP